MIVVPSSSGDVAGCAEGSGGGRAASGPEAWVVTEAGGPVSPRFESVTDAAVPDADEREWEPLTIVAFPGASERE